MRFFDASAIVKGYVVEAGGAQVTGLLARGSVALSQLSEVEVVSAFARLARDGFLTPAQRDRKVSKFLADVGGWLVVQMSPEVVSTAQQLLLRHPLRAGHAIQVATALVLQTRIARPIDAFVAYDQRVVDAARAEGLTVLTR